MVSVATIDTPIVVSCTDPSLWYFLLLLQFCCRRCHCPCPHQVHNNFLPPPLGNLLPRELLHLQTQARDRTVCNVLCDHVLVVGDIFSTSSSHASSIALSRGGYFQILSTSLQEFMHIIWWSIRWWNPPRLFLMHRFMTHISNPNRRTTWTMALYNIPILLASTLSRPKIRDSRAHFFQAFQILSTTAGN